MIGLIPFDKALSNIQYLLYDSGDTTGLAAHAKTNRWVYTPPSNVNSYLLRTLVKIIRITASAAGLATAGIEHGTLQQVLSPTLTIAMAQMRIGTLGTMDSDSFEDLIVQGSTQNPSPNVSMYTEDLGTTGTSRYFGMGHFLEIYQ